MANGDEELDQQHGQGADELEAPEVDGHDAQGDDLRQYDQHLGELIQRGTQAGYADQTATLRRVRKALRGTRAQIQAAEERGRQRALEEFQAGNEQAVDALREQVRVELQEETARERSFARLGIGPDSPVRQLFADVQGDHAAFERQAALLRAAGVTWSADPVVREIGRQQAAAAVQQAQQGQANGHVDLTPQPAMPEQVREAMIAQGVGQMAAAQAGGEVISAQSPLERDIEEAQRHPDLMLRDDARQSLADRFNRELDGLSRAQGGAWG